MKSLIFLILLSLSNTAFSKAGTGGEEPVVCPKPRTAIQANTQESDNSNTAPVTRPAPVRDVRNVTPRTVSPRWHSMLPGMFR